MEGQGRNTYAMAAPKQSKFRGIWWLPGKVHFFWVLSSEPLCEQDIPLSTVEESTCVDTSYLNVPPPDEAA